MTRAANQLLHDLDQASQKRHLSAVFLTSLTPSRTVFSPLAESIAHQGSQNVQLL